MPPTQAARSKTKATPTGIGSTESPSLMGTKYRWLLKEADGIIIRNIAYRHGLSLPVAQVLATRGIRDDEQIRSFLFSSFEQDVAHPSQMKGVAAAAQRIINAIDRKEKILIFGDYDVDGVTASSLALAALLPLGANINFHLPNRQTEGYGLSRKAVSQAHKSGYSLIITVDNGIAAHDAAKAAYKLGIDLIITDHHQQHGDLPPALSIINPNQRDCLYPFKYLAGVGVAFKLISLIYELKGIPLPNKIYELLLLGTVADVVPLIGENRFWVRHGLCTINKGQSTALRVLAGNASLTKDTLNSLDIGFMIAPQINALGRLADPRDAVKFMISSDATDVERIGTILKTMNEERKKIEQQIYQQIDYAMRAKKIDIANEYVIIEASDQWPSGVIGLVAGKLLHNYGRPTLLFHLDKGIAKGSCRSIPEFNIFQALAQNQDLLMQFGGHACAAGLKLKQEHLPLLKERLSQQVAATLTLQDLHPKITIDATLDLTEATFKLLSDLEQLEPFGNQNPQPLFLVKNVSLLKPPQLLKERHVKCTVFSNGIIKPVIFFNRPELMETLEQIADQPFNLAAHVIRNEWEGTVRIDLQGIDIAR